jgi:carboxyl-terminal processing protease
MQKESISTSLQRKTYPTVLVALFIIFQILIVAVSFLGGFLFHEWRFAEDLFAKSNYPLLDEASNILKENAFFPLPEDKQLEYGMIRGMLGAYNEPYTIFVEPPQHELQTNQLEGRFGGIGVRIERDAQNLVYLFPLPNSPAAKAGVLDGDRLIAVEDMPVTAQTSADEIQAAVRGPVGKKVKITVGHPPDYAPVELDVEREEVPLPSITWNLAPEESRVGVIHINVIADTTPEEVTKAIQELQQQGANRFVLDVRNNGGGLVEAGVNTARLFLKEGTVIEEQYRGKPVKVFDVPEPGLFANLPMVLLVNQGTASAAEIFAGALKGQQRARVVGTNTYGKDSIQLVFSLSDGSSLHVTAAQWWVPDLNPAIGEKGIQPDVQVDINANPDAALQKAIETVLEE